MTLYVPGRVCAIALLLAIPDACHTAPSSPETVKLPGAPFQVVTSRDGRWVFASMSGRTPGVAVLRRDQGRLQLIRTARVDPDVAGMVLTHEGKVLIAANGEGVVFLDVDRLTSGKGEPVKGSVRIGAGVGAIHVNATSVTPRSR